jgi:DNA-binding transcriptional MerR regulator
MEKSAEAFRTISEVSDLLNTPAHVLRFWESRFSQIKPVKRAGGRRYYRPADLALLGGVKKLLHEEGLTIRGVQKILKEQGIKHVSSMSPDFLASADTSADGAATVAASKAKPAPAQKETPSPSGGVDITAVSQAMQRPDTSPGADRRAAMGQAEKASEAPMHVDAPTLDPQHRDNIHAIDDGLESGGAKQATSPATAEEVSESPPAAAMLRAMDTVRARDKKPELTSVYLRLVDLKERLARSGTSSRG